MEGSGEAGEVFINWNVAEAKEPWQQSTSHQEDIYKINVNVNYEQEEAEEEQVGKSNHNTVFFYILAKFAQ